MGNSSQGAYLLDVEIDDVRPMKNQPRLYFDPDELSYLADSLGVGQEQWIIITPIPDATEKPHFELNDGERRLRAAKRARLAKLKAIVVPWEDEDARFERGFRANLGVPLSPYEKMLACARLKRNRGYTVPELCRRTNLKPSTVEMYLRMTDKLHGKVLQAMSPHLPPQQRLRLMVANELIGEPKEKQLEYLPQVVGMAEQSAKAILRSRTSKKYGRGRRPAEEFYSLLGGIDRTRRNSLYYASLGAEAFKRMFANRPEPKDDQRQALKEIDNTIQALQRLRRLVKGAL